jgi:hypothetical protein
VAETFHVRFCCPLIFFVPLDDGAHPVLVMHRPLQSAPFGKLTECIDRQSINSANIPVLLHFNFMAGNTATSNLLVPLNMHSLYRLGFQMLD